MKIWSTDVMLLPKILPVNEQARMANIERQLMAYEARVGSQIFGELPKGHRRQFFCLDAHTWVWYEEWKEKGKIRNVTTRYELHPSGVLKVQDGKSYEKLSDQESQNLFEAVKMYCQKVTAEYARVLQTI